MFIKVKIDNLKEFSKDIPLKLNKQERVKRDKIKMIIVKKYLFISFNSKLIFENISLLIKIFFGLLKDKIWFNEYLNNEYILINLRPELVEKKDPPIITKIKNMKLSLFEVVFKEKPMLDILLVIEKKFTKKSFFKLKKIKKIKVTTKK